MARRPFCRPPIAVLSVLAAASLACAARPAPRSDPIPHEDAGALTVRLKALDAALDQVEGRLLASQASVSLWDELRNRHENVSAVTCTNLSAHANAIAAFMHRERDRRPVRSKNRLASRTVVPATALR